MTYQKIKKGNVVEYIPYETRWKITWERVDYNGSLECVCIKENKLLSKAKIGQIGSMPPFIKNGQSYRLLGLNYQEIWNKVCSKTN